jgi:hypothetical protein
MEYQIQASTRRCAESGRELSPGERYYSVLVNVSGTLVRKDFAAGAWHGPPPGAFSFWAGRMPAAEKRRRRPVDDGLLVEYFQRLEGEDDVKQISFRYVIALLLMRRKRFQFEEARIEAGREILALRCVRTKARYLVVNPRLAPAEMTAIQDEIVRVLGWQ